MSEITFAPKTDRTIILHQMEGGPINISIGNKHLPELCPDEALFVVAQLLLNLKPRFDMRTVDEWSDRAVDMYKSILRREMEQEKTEVAP